MRPSVVTSTASNLPSRSGTKLDLRSRRCLVRIGRDDHTRVLREIGEQARCILHDLLGRWGS